MRLRSCLRLSPPGAGGAAAISDFGLRIADCSDCSDCGLAKGGLVAPVCFAGFTSDFLSGLGAVFLAADLDFSDFGFRISDFGGKGALVALDGFDGSAAFFFAGLGADFFAGSFFDEVFLAAGAAGCLGAGFAAAGFLATGLAGAVFLDAEVFRAEATVAGLAGAAGFLAGGDFFSGADFFLVGEDF